MVATPSRIFVTGATGVIGARVVPELVRRGFRVTAVGRSAEKRAQLESRGARAISLDMFDADAARAALQGHDTVINLATHIPPSTFRTLFRREWRENDRIRRQGSATLVDAAIASGVQRFIQESFAPIYEDGGDRWIDESWPVRPVAYNMTVLDAERSAQRFTQTGGAGVVLRFAAFYGADAIMRDILGVVRRGWSPVPGRAGAYWSSISHDDAAAAVVAALSVPAGVYNICDDEPVTRRELVDTLAAAIDAKPPRLLPTWLTRLGGSLMELGSRSQRMTNAAFKRASAWTPRLPSVREGFPEVVRALRA
ncbi:MAG: NAD-dependent epimerase/dehydratase family protein [Gemmatimonadaceae bacterium]